MQGCTRTLWEIKKNGWLLLDEKRWEVVVGWKELLVCGKSSIGEQLSIGRLKTL
jgi:hypothetical protein